METEINPATVRVIVLLVEDDQNVRELAATFLHYMGCTVLDAGSGEQALKLAKNHPGPIHVLVSDVALPGMTGLELAGHMLEDYPGIKVIFASGYPDYVLSQHGIAEGTATILPKPYRQVDLVQTVNFALQGIKAGIPAGSIDSKGRLL